MNECGTTHAPASSLCAAALLHSNHCACVHSADDERGNECGVVPSRGGSGAGRCRLRVGPGARGRQRSARARRRGAVAARRVERTHGGRDGVGGGANAAATADAAAEQGRTQGVRHAGGHGRQHPRAAGRRRRRSRAGPGAAAAGGRGCSAGLHCKQLHRSADEEQQAHRALAQ